MTGHFPRHVVQSWGIDGLFFTVFQKWHYAHHSHGRSKKVPGMVRGLMKFLQTKQIFFVNIYFAEVPEKCWLWQLTKINFHTGEKWEPRATARTNTGNLNMRNNVSLWGGSRLGEGDGMEGGGAILHFSTHCLIMDRIFWILPFRLAAGVKSCWRSSGVCLVLT